MVEPAAAAASPVSASPTVPLRTVAAVFLYLGTTSFGGPAAHIARMEEEVVRRRGWLTHKEFLDLLGAVNLIPGPNSTEMAIHIGHRVAGWLGLLIAGASFILPATLIVLAFAWAYVNFGALPPVEGVLFGVKPVILAVIVQALWKLGRICVKSWPLAILALVAIGLTATGFHELLVLFGAGFLVALIQLLRLRPGRPPTAFLAVMAATPLPLAGGMAAGSAVSSVGLWPLFLFFLKVGSVLFGSGYVLLAFLRTDLVERYGWMTEQQLLDAIAVGQITPGPVFTTATFIGYLLAGPVGGVVATVGIFLPAFVFVALSVPLLPRLRKSKVAAAFLDGVNVASLALMAVVTCELGAAAFRDVHHPVLRVASAVLGVGSAVLLLRYRVNSTWLVLGGAAVGLLLNGLVH